MLILLRAIFYPLNTQLEIYIVLANSFTESESKYKIQDATKTNFE